MNRELSVNYPSTRAIVLLGAMLLATTTFAITIETVPVGNVGDPNEPGTGNLYCGVNCASNIGTTQLASLCF